MNLKKIVLAAITTILLILFAAWAVLPVMAKTNIALNCKIDSVCPGGDTITAESPDFLIDDDPGHSTKWHAVNGDKHTGKPHWIILDFETEKWFSGIRLVKASEGEKDYGLTKMDTCAFHFDVSDDKSSWTTVLTVTNDGDNSIYDGDFPGGAVKARFLRLVIDHPEQSETSDENSAVNLYDLRVWEAADPSSSKADVPAPAPMPAANNNTPLFISTALIITTTAPDTADSVLLFVLSAIISILIAVSSGIILIKSRMGKIK